MGANCDLSHPWSLVDMGITGLALMATFHDFVFQLNNERRIPILYGSHCGICLNLGNRLISVSFLCRRCLSPFFRPEVNSVSSTTLRTQHDRAWQASHS